MLYIGKSMNPTLRNLDKLLVRRYEDSDVNTGDVVIFVSPGGNQKMVHRVSGISSGVIQTRGDNNRNDDPFVLKKSDILGQVIQAQRGAKRIPVEGGNRGLAISLSVARRNLILNIVKKIITGILNVLPQNRRFPVKINSRLFRVISIDRESGDECRLMLGKYVIGRLGVNGRSWEIRSPFKYFIDTSNLPGEIKTGSE